MEVDPSAQMKTENDASPPRQERRRSSLDKSIIDMKEKEETFTANLVRNDTLKGKKGPSGGLDLRKASLVKSGTSKCPLPSDVVKETGETMASTEAPSSQSSVSAKPAEQEEKNPQLGLGMSALGLAHKEETYTSKIKKNDTLAKRRMSITKDEFSKTQSQIAEGPNVELALGASQQLPEEPVQPPCITENLDLAGVDQSRVTDIKEGVAELKSTEAKALLAKGTCVGASNRKKEELEKAKALDKELNTNAEVASPSTDAGGTNAEAASPSTDAGGK